MDYEIVPDESGEAEAREGRILTWPVLAGAALGLAVLMIAWLMPADIGLRNALFVGGALLMAAMLGLLGWRLIVHQVRKVGQATVYISKRLGK
jgi:hypothetical protein